MSRSADATAVRVAKRLVAGALVDYADRSGETRFAFSWATRGATELAAAFC